MKMMRAAKRQLNRFNAPGGLLMNMTSSADAKSICHKASSRAVNSGSMVYGHPIRTVKRSALHDVLSACYRLEQRRGSSAESQSQGQIWSVINGRRAETYLNRERWSNHLEIGIVHFSGRQRAYIRNESSMLHTKFDQCVGNLWRIAFVISATHVERALRLTSHVENGFNKSHSARDVCIVRNSCLVLDQRRKDSWKNAPACLYAAAVTMRGALP